MARKIIELSGAPMAFKRRHGDVMPVPYHGVTPQDVLAFTQIAGKVADTAAVIGGAARQSYRRGQAEDAASAKAQAQTDAARQADIAQQRQVQEPARLAALRDLAGGRDAMAEMEAERMDASAAQVAGLDWSGTADQQARAAGEQYPFDDPNQMPVGGDPRLSAIQQMAGIAAQPDSLPGYEGGYGMEGTRGFGVMAVQQQQPPPMPVVDEMKLSPAARAHFSRKADELQAQVGAQMAAPQPAPGAEGVAAQAQGGDPFADQPFPDTQATNANPLAGIGTNLGRNGLEQKQTGFDTPAPVSGMGRSSGGMGRQITQDMGPKFTSDVQAFKADAIPTMASIRAEAFKAGQSQDPKAIAAVLQQFEQNQDHLASPESWEDWFTGGHTKRAQAGVLELLKRQFKPGAADSPEAIAYKATQTARNRELGRRYFEQNSPGQVVPSDLLRPGESYGTIATGGLGSADTSKRTGEATVAGEKALAAPERVAADTSKAQAQAHIAGENAAVAGRVANAGMNRKEADARYAGTRADVLGKHGMDKAATDIRKNRAAAGLSEAKTKTDNVMREPNRKLAIAKTGFFDRSPMARPPINITLPSGDKLTEKLQERIIDSEEAQRVARQLAKMPAVDVMETGMRILKIDRASAAAMDVETLRAKAIAALADKAEHLKRLRALIRATPEERNKMLGNPAPDEKGDPGA